LYGEWRILHKKEFLSSLA